MVETVERVLPSVVSVMSSKMVKGPSMGFFFGGRPGSEKQQGVGSGVILTKDGIIVTNNHVVEGADEVIVRLADDREFPAKVLGTDPRSDLAVLEIDRAIKGLVPITIGDSGTLRLGESVLAVGNPFGVGQTVTMGIVSAKGRADMGITDYEDFIQTDAAINPGNSGGALVNERGELVGINTAILSKSGGSMGIGFAIPTQMAVPIVEALRTEGRVSRGYLGVGIQDLSGDLRAALGLGEKDGVILAEVDPNGPAGKSGLMSGDVVTQVNDIDVHSTGQFRNLIASAGAKKSVKLALVRDGKARSLSVELGQLPDQAARTEESPEENKAGSDHAGLALRTVDDEVRSRLRLAQGVSGAVIVRVEPGSKAAAAGLRPYDVITEVDKTPVTNPEGVKKLLTSEPAKPHLLRIQRAGASLFVVLK
jgi:serine protease Do